MNFLWILAAVLAILLLPWIFYGICALFVNPKKEYKKDSRFYRTILNIATAIGLKLIRIRVMVEGLEQIPKDARFLLVSNHRSKFDPIISWYVFRKWKPAFISKEANFHIFIFGRIIRKCCFMVIDRENPRIAIKTVNDAADLLKQGEVSIGAYPEGTRSKTYELLPFHNGMFKIAQKANAPLVVMTIDGTEKIHKNFPLHSTKVTLKVLKLIPAEELADKRSETIGDEVHKMMSISLGFEPTQTNIATENPTDGAAPVEETDDIKAVAAANSAQQTPENNRK